MNADFYVARKTPYVINLDPAVYELPYTANIDIRDTVKYKNVMKEYNLGPNGAIITSLNLFSTKFDQVLDKLEKRAESKNITDILIDTPGQIEVFTWSASGTIITETLSSLFPTVVAYVVDTPRCTSPATFMSNMLYACSIMYKTKLPFILVFNKTDIQDHQVLLEWMTDFEAFQEAASKDESSYMTSLVQSMGLVLEEFYKNFRCVGVSAFTGEGMDDFFSAVKEAVAEYNCNRLEVEKDNNKRKEENLEKFLEDLKLEKSKTV